MKRFSRLAAALLSLMILLCACQQEPVEQPVPGWPVSVAGVTFETSPARVVTLSPSLTETLYILGYGGRVVGVGDNCDRPSAVSDRPRCGTVLAPDVAAILKLAPDLLLTATDLPEQALAQLREAGVQVLVIRWADDLETLYGNWRTIYLAFEGEERGQLRDEQLRYYADAVLTDALSSVRKAVGSEPPSVIWLRHLPLTMATGDTLEGGWLDEMGLRNQAADFTGWSYPLEAEPDLNPDIILYDLSIDADALTAHDYYSRTGAVANGRIYPVNSNIFERQTPAMFDELWEMMAEIFPSGFGDRPSDIILPLPEPEPEPEPGWFDRILNRFRR